MFSLVTTHCLITFMQTLEHFSFQRGSENSKTGSIPGRASRSSAGGSGCSTVSSSSLSGSTSDSGSGSCSAASTGTKDTGDSISTTCSSGCMLPLLALQLRIGSKRLSKGISVTVILYTAIYWIWYQWASRLQYTLLVYIISSLHNHNTLYMLNCFQSRWYQRTLSNVKCNYIVVLHHTSADHTIN